MLHLQARIDLEQVKFAILQQELDGAGTLIADRTSEANRSIAHVARANFSSTATEGDSSINF